MQHTIEGLVKWTIASCKFHDTCIFT